MCPHIKFQAKIKVAYSSTDIAEIAFKKCNWNKSSVKIEWKGYNAAWLQVVDNIGKNLSFENLDLVLIKKSSSMAKFSTSPKLTFF